MTAYGIREATDTHTSLSVTGQGVLSSEPGATGALVRLATRVDFGVALEVVLADEAFTAAVATVLAVAEMGLHVGSDVFAASEGLVAAWVETCPFA